MMRVKLVTQITIEGASDKTVMAKRISSNTEMFSGPLGPQPGSGTASGRFAEPGPRPEAGSAAGYREPP